MDTNNTRQSLLLDQQLCFSLYACGLAMNRIYRQQLKPLGLTYPQYLVMLVLWEGDEQSVSAIGERLQLDSATLTPLLKRMEAQELLSRTRSATDERQVIIRLSPAGLALQQQAAGIPAAILCSSHCSVEELTMLKRQLDALRARLDSN